VIHGTDSVPDPGAKVIKLDDAPAGDRIVVGPARLKVVVALWAPPEGSFPSGAATATGIGAAVERRGGRTFYGHQWPGTHRDATGIGRPE
jgi:hypothetical protein